MSQEQEHDHEEVEIDPNEEQAKLLQKILHENDLLRKENDLLTAIVAKQSQARSTNEEPKRSASVRKSRSEVEPLTEEEKNDLVSSAIESLQSETAALKRSGQHEVDEIQCMIEEIEMHISDIKKDTFEFKRDVIIGGENPMTGATNSDKVIKFFEDRAAVKHGFIEKLAAKNATARALRQRLDTQLKQKEEMGEVLHVVDFEQLKIEHEQYVEKLEAKNRELKRLKVTTGRLIQNVNDMKEELHDQVARGQELRAAIAAKEALSKRTKEDTGYTKKQVKNATGYLKGLENEQKDVEQPQIIQYIKAKHEVETLEKQAGELKRRNDLAELRLHSTLKSLRRAEHAASGTFGHSSSHGHDGVSRHASFLQQSH